MLTSSEEYLRCNGTRCPVCESQDIQPVEDFYVTWLVQTRLRVSCKNCLATWTEVYTLTGIEDINEGE